MDIRDFSREEIPKIIAKYLRSGIFLNFANEYADALEDGTWLIDIEEGM